MSDGPTFFMESNALLLVQAFEHDQAERIVRDMLPNERRSLIRAASELIELCERVNAESVSRERV